MSDKGIIYRHRCGAAWRDLPEVFGPWQTVWTSHHRLAVKGTWDTIVRALIAQADAEGLVDWSVSVDSTIARAHQRLDEHDAPHRGLDQISRIQPPSRLIKGSVAHAVASRRRSINSSTATVSRWSP